MLTNCIHDWDSRRKLAIPGDAKETLQFCVDHFIESCQAAILQHGAFYVALSGGSTPQALFTLLTHAPYSSQINWQKVHLFWSDERSVPKDHIDSNFHMAMKAGFAEVPIPPEQIHRMKAEADIEKEALSYEELLRLKLPGGRFDYLMLGMGEDGHTASLFPETKALSETTRWVIANYVPQKNTWRMTLSFSCINAANHIVLYVLGKSKQEKLLEIFSSKSPLYPVEHVGTRANKALWITDTEAAKLLPVKSLNS
jgi:6-phosphogluconolactonase